VCVCVCVCVRVCLSMREKERQPGDAPLTDASACVRARMCVCA